MVDLLFLAIIGWDIRSYLSNDLTASELWAPDVFLNMFWSLETLKLVLVFGLFVPIAMIALKFLLFSRRMHRDSVGPDLRNVFISFHGLFVLLAIYFSNAVDHLQSMSGIVTDESGRHFAFEPILGTAELYYGIMILNALPILVELGAYKFGNKSLKNLKSRFVNWLNLADQISYFLPDFRSTFIYANNASLAAPIRIIEQQTRQLRWQYQKSVPTTEVAKNFVLAKASECQQALSNYMTNGDKVLMKEMQIDFLPGTSRALEVGLCLTSNLQAVILSPYEHPSQKKVVDWFCAQHKIQSYMDDCDYRKFARNQKEQSKYLLSSVKRNLKETTGKVAVVLSEVNYLTGFRIDVQYLIQKIRKCTGGDIVFFIDGSQAVGNIVAPYRPFMHSLEVEDYYYFSGHKWLLSPVPCGVLVSSKRNYRSKKSYDMWGDDLPSATIDPDSVFGLNSSVNFLMKDKKIKQFRKMSMELRERFETKVKQDLKLNIFDFDLELDDQSQFCAVRPADGMKWNYDNALDFEEGLKRMAIDLTLVDLHGKADGFWLRLSFPYFLENREVDQIYRLLSKLVRPVA